MVPEFSGHVLIIEDEPVIALELELLLGDMCFRSFAAADCPEDALASARTRRPELITADYRILSGTGPQAVDLITRAIGEVPVVYVTGNGDLLPHAAGRPVVDKPISPTALAAAFARAQGRPTLDG